jgi:hypothetical protein
MTRGKKTSRVFTALKSRFYINVRKAALVWKFDFFWRAQLLTLKSTEIVYQSPILMPQKKTLRLHYKQESVS